MRATKMEINLKAYKENMKKIQEYVENKELMPVIKANGYGTHINMCIDVMSEYNIVALAIVDEGKVLRNLGYKNEIFILNQPDVDDIEDIFKYDITIKYADNENEYEVNFVANYKGLSTLSKVTEEYSLGINLNIAGNTSKYLYTVNNNVQFKNNITIDDLNENTAVILNDRDAEYITNLFTAVTQRITEVNNSHLQELGLDTNPLIYATPIAMLGQISNDIDNQ